MTPRAAWVAGPIGLVAVVAAAAGVWFGPVHWVAATVALGLCMPPAAATYWLTRWLAARHPLGVVIGMLAGALVRLVVVMGGGAVVFFATGWFADAKVAFWFWLLFAYLATLVAEMALLAGAMPPAGGARDRKG